MQQLLATFRDNVRQLQIILRQQKEWRLPLNWIIITSNAVAIVSLRQQSNEQLLFIGSFSDLGENYLKYEIKNNICNSKLFELLYYS